MDVVVVAVRAHGDEAEKRGDDDVVRLVRYHGPHLVHEDRLDVRDHLVALRSREFAARLYLREEPARLAVDEEIVHHREEHDRDDVVVVVPREKEDEKHRGVLRDRREGADVRHDVAAMVGVEDRSPVREKEVAYRRVDEMHEIEDVKIEPGREIALHETAEEREKANESFSNAVKAISNGLGADGMQDRSRIREAVMSYIADRSIYDVQASRGDNIAGVLVDNRAFCAGYSKTAVKMLREFGIPAVYVSGTVNKGKDEEVEHAWIFTVDEDGHAMWSDPTWYDAAVGSFDFGIYNTNWIQNSWYEFSKNHVIDTPWIADEQVR